MIKCNPGKAMFALLIACGIMNNYKANAQKLGDYHADDNDEIFSTYWLRGFTGWDEGLIKLSASRSSTIFNRTGFGIHFDQTKQFGFWSTGYNPLFLMQGGTGNSFFKGNIGLGTGAPQARLEVLAPTAGTAAGIFHSNGEQAWGHVISLVTDKPGGDDARLLFSYRNKAKQWAVGGQFNINRFSIWEDAGDGNYGSTYGTERFTIQAGGNVGIGISNPANALDVNGTIHSKVVKVDMNGWSDDVFDDNFKLLPLDAVKDFIVRYHHLPDVPSAGDVEKSGLDLGAMNKILLKKVEELTLHLIKASKDLKRQQMQLKLQQQQIQKIKKHML